MHDNAWYIKKQSVYIRKIGHFLFQQPDLCFPTVFMGVGQNSTRPVLN